MKFSLIHRSNDWHDNYFSSILTISKNSPLSGKVPVDNTPYSAVILHRPQNIGACGHDAPSRTSAFRECEQLKGGGPRTLASGYRSQIPTKDRMRVLCSQKGIRCNLWLMPLSFFRNLLELGTKEYIWKTWLLKKKAPPQH